MRHTSSMDPTSFLSTRSAASASKAPAASSIEADLKLAQVLHVRVSVLYGTEPHLGPEKRETTHHREVALRPHFPETHGRQKFVQVVQALVTLCTAQSGDDNVAAMVALSTEDIKLCICQNDGRSFLQIKQHLGGVWRILQKLNSSIPTTTPDRHNPIAPPRVSSNSELDLSAKLLDISYLFVAEKALGRVKKRLPFLQKLHARVSNNDPSPWTNDFQKNLIETLLGVAVSATTVAQAGLANLSQRQDWQDFRICTHLLYNITISPAYADNTEAIEILQVRAQQTGFDFKKTLQKAVKVEAAALTLGRLAVSPNRGWITGLNLHIHQILVPPKRLVHVQLDDLNAWCPPGVTLRDFHLDLRKAAAYSTEKEISIASKNFNKECTTKVAFDGSHGGVKPGWLPPTLDIPLTQMQEQLKEALRMHEKKPSASSTSSDPAITLSKPSTNADEQVLMLSLGSQKCGNVGDIE
ncbi:hypothetical protein C8R44DRAFT_975205 [Mycena epipterygia]|nr:hypothetical protein C8R44DRAFT_975205 [Mycena epipterygia]